MASKRLGGNRPTSVGLVVGWLSLGVALGGCLGSVEDDEDEPPSPRSRESSLTVTVDDGPVAATSASEIWPAISGSRIAYVEVNVGGVGGRVVVIDLEDPDFEPNLPQPGADEFQMNPDIDGDRLVYWSTVASDMTVYLNDLSDPNSPNIPLSSSGLALLPSVDGYLAVWTELGGTCDSLIVVDNLHPDSPDLLKLGCEADSIELPPGVTRPTDPTISGSWVVFRASNEVLAWDGVTGVFQHLGWTDDQMASPPHIRGSVVAFATPSATDFDIRRCHLDSEQCETLARPGPQTEAVVCDNAVVFTEDRQDGQNGIELSLWPAGSDQAVELTPIAGSGSRRFFDLDCDGTTVVYTEQVAGGFDVGALTFTFTSGNLVANPPALDFDSVEVGAQLTRALELGNDGDGVLHIESITVTGSGFSIGDNPAPIDLAANSSVQFDVTFAPSSGGLAEGELVVVSDDPDTASLVVGLTGVGTLLEPTTVDELIEWLDLALAEGRITGRGGSGAHKAATFRKMLATAGWLIDARYGRGGCALLGVLSELADGERSPTDWLAGDDLANLHELLLRVTEATCGG